MTLESGYDDFVSKLQKEKKKNNNPKYILSVKARDGIRSQV